MDHGGEWTLGPNPLPTQPPALWGQPVGHGLSMWPPTQAVPGGAEDKDGAHVSGSPCFPVREDAGPHTDAERMGTRAGRWAAGCLSWPGGHTCLMRRGREPPAQAAAGTRHGLVGQSQPAGTQQPELRQSSQVLASGPSCPLGHPRTSAPAQQPRELPTRSPSYLPPTERSDTA